MLDALISLIKSPKSVLKAVLSLSVAFLLCSSAILYTRNKKLSERLEQSYNNIEAYQELLNNSQQANRVLQLSIQDLQNSNDSLLQDIQKIAKENSIKLSKVNTAATQTQKIDVKSSKGVQGDLIEILKDTVYSDSIIYNDQTKVCYTIGKDTVDVDLQISNTQYLYTYKHKEWKNKKSFIKRLFTLDFKKITKYDYKIVNTNELINMSDVRVVEIKD